MADKRPIANPDPFLTTEEAADYLNVPVGTVRYWAHLRTGPRSYKMGRLRRYRVSDLEEWLTHCTEPGRDDPPRPYAAKARGSRR